MIPAVLLIDDTSDFGEGLGVDATISSRHEFPSSGRFIPGAAPPSTAFAFRPRSHSDGGRGRVISNLEENPWYPYEEES